MDKQSEFAFVVRVTGFMHTKKHGVETTAISLEHGTGEIGDRTPPMTGHVVIDGRIPVEIDEQFEMRLTRRVEAKP